MWDTNLRPSGQCKRTSRIVSSRFEGHVHCRTWAPLVGREVHPDRAIILMLVDTGIRAQELCDLLVKDYDNKLGRLRVRHGKGNKSRPVFKGESGRKAPWRCLADRGVLKPEEPLFVTRSGTPLEPNALWHMIERCAARAGVERANIHRFRHMFAINFLRNGGSFLDMQRMLGHEQLNTVRIYASLAESDLQEAQRKASPADNWRL